MKGRVLSFLILTVSIYSRSVFADELFTYSVKGFPGEDSCQATAVGLGARFAEATGKPVFKTSCDAEYLGNYNISITYASDQEVSFVSTSYELDEFAYLGIYSSRAQCQQYLPQERASFEEMTGLTSFLSYCYQESFINRTPFVARIDAFGNAHQYPFRFASRWLFGTPLGDYYSLMSEIIEKATSAKIGVKQASIAEQGGEVLVIRYYDSPDNFIHQLNYFVLEQVAQYYSFDPKATQELCLSQINEAKAVFNSEFANPSIWFCTWSPSLFQASLYWLRIKPQVSLLIEEVPLRYKSFAECNGERDSTVDFYNSKLGKKAYGALCGWDIGLGGQRGYKMQVYIKPGILK